MVNKPNWCAYEIMLTNLFRTHFILSGQFLEFNVECYSQITSKKLESKYNMTRISNSGLSTRIIDAIFLLYVELFNGEYCFF